jgi:signal transduction histidine kinase
LTAAPPGGASDGVQNSDALRRTISHVVALSTLSAVWAGAARSRIADSLAQVVREALDCNAVYVVLRGTGAAGTHESSSVRDSGDQPLVEEIREDLAGWVRAINPAPLPQPARRFASAATPIGIWAEHGLIVVASCGDANFPSDTQRLLLNVAANQATVALLTERARDEQRIADTLQRLGTDIAGEMDPEKVIQIVTDEVTGLTGANFGAFFYNVVEPSGESYMLFTLSGAPRDAFSQFPMPRNTAIFEATFKGTAVVRLDDVTADPRFGHNPPYHGLPAGHLPVKSYLAVPVISRTGRVHGGLFLGHKDVGVFLERHERLAVGVAAWAALAMDNGYLYAEAQRANLAKDQFLATLSHELRTPLNAIMGWLSMLRRPEVMTREGVPKAWTAVDRNTNALAALIEDLLDVSRIATGKFRLVETDLDLTEVARDSIRTIEPLFAEKGVALTVDLTRTPCTLRGDVGRLRQVAGNLLANALKFTAAGGQVGISVMCDDTTASLIVTDTGIGIHPDFLPHVFERFRQGDTKSGTGLGLGLAIVKNLVELHGGTVGATSGGIGRGSQFTVTLPRDARL